MTKLFIGIDIQIRRNCCYAVIDESGILIESGWFPNAETDAVDLVKRLSKSGQIYVGIDAPRMPRISKRQWCLEQCKTKMESTEIAERKWSALRSRDQCTPTGQSSMDTS